MTEAQSQQPQQQAEDGSNYAPISNVRSVRQIESARLAHQTLTILINAMNSGDGQAIIGAYEKFNASFSSFRAVLAESKDETHEKIDRSVSEATELVLAIAKDVIQGNKARISEMWRIASIFEQAISTLVNWWFNFLGLSSNAQAELMLMTAKLDSLQSQVNSNAAETQSIDNELRKLVFSEAKVLLRMARNLGREAQAQTEYLYKNNQILSNESGLIKAAVQTSDSASMFFLLLKKVPQEDPDFKYKVIAACKDMKAALTNIIVNLRAKGTGGEISSRIEEISKDLFARLASILDAATKYQAKGVVPIDQIIQGKSIIVRKRNADTEVFRRRRALEEAEEKLKRLNRSQGATMRQGK